MEREKFEESWKKAFDEAEVSPSEKVWTNIELDLEKARGGDLKKRLLFYQMLAAASVVFALGIAGVGYYAYNTGHSPENALAVQTQQPAETAQRSSEPVPTNDSEISISDDATSNLKEADRVPDANPIASTESERRIENETRSQNGALRASRTSNPALASERTDDGGEQNTAGPPAWLAYANAVPSELNDRDLPPLYTPREVTLNFARQQEPEVDPVVAMLAKLERREREVQSEEEKEKGRSDESERLWTSIGFAAGSFNTVQASAPGPSASNGSAFAMAANAAPIVDQETKATGYSYTMGLNIGTRISERWVLQGGVNYLTNSSEYTANNVIMEPSGKFSEHRFRAVSTNDLINTDERDLNNKLVYTAPYSVNNSMRYLSIPLQAGYLLVNKTFGLQLNAGVATDLFLQNTVKGEGDQLAKTSQSLGSDSPYRTVNLSGLFGTEFSYRFGPHYRVSLNPGIRYPFNTIYKSELGVDSTPLTFDVGLRFRYIFH